MKVPVTLKFKNATVTFIRISEHTNGRGSAIDSWNAVQYFKKAILKMEMNSEDWSNTIDDIYTSKLNLKTPGTKQYHIMITLTNWSKFIREYKINLRPNENVRDLKAYILTNIKETIRIQRKVSRHIQPYHVRWFDTTVEFMGTSPKSKVFNSKEQVLKVYINKNMQKLYEDKKPTQQNKYIGIELEFCAPISKDQMALKLFKSNFFKYVQLKEDHSLRPKDGEVGFEFAILLKESNYKKELKKITEFLKEVGAVAEDRRCGLHVHFDMRKRDKDMVYNNLVACQEVLCKLTDPRRYDSEFCRIVTSKKFPTSFTGKREERYKTINAASYYRHQTLEVRMHEGCINFGAIVSWIEILLRVVNYDKKVKYDIESLPRFKRRFKVPRKLYQKALDKSCYWQVNQADFNRNNTGARLDTLQQMLRLPDEDRPRATNGGAQGQQEFGITFQDTAGAWAAINETEIRNRTQPIPERLPPIERMTWIDPEDDNN